MTKLIVLSFLFLSISCKVNNQEIIKSKVVPAMAKGIATGLECSRPDLIEADIHKVLKTVKIETANPAVGAVCKTAVDVVVPILIKNGIPKSWECKGTMATEGLKALGGAVCSAL